MPEYRNSTDINIKPSQGIKPKTPTIKGMRAVIYYCYVNFSALILTEQQATGLEQPIKEQSTVYTTTQLQEEIDDSLLV